MDVCYSNLLRNDFEFEQDRKVLSSQKVATHFPKNASKLLVRNSLICTVHIAQEGYKNSIFVFSFLRLNIDFGT